jgi:hypothetical protein
MILNLFEDFVTKIKSEKRYRTFFEMKSCRIPSGNSKAMNEPRIPKNGIRNGEKIRDVDISNR